MAICPAQERALLKVVHHRCQAIALYPHKLFLRNENRTSLSTVFWPSKSASPKGKKLSLKIVIICTLCLLKNMKRRFIKYWSCVTSQLKWRCLISPHWRRSICHSIYYTSLFMYYCRLLFIIHRFSLFCILLMGSTFLNVSRIYEIKITEC